MGGTGCAIDVVDGRERYVKKLDPALPPEIEHIYPDYGLYPSVTRDTAFGFLTRGCPNFCPYCVVSKKEGVRSYHAADLTEFWHKQRNITVMDANILACDEAVDLLHSLAYSGANLDFNQGLDARYVDEDMARLLGKMKIEMVRFAFDRMCNEAEIIRGLTLFRKYFKKSDRHCKVYILCNFDSTPAEDWYRVKKVIELGFRPDIRIYQKGTHSQFHTDLGRWSNSNLFFHSCSFEDFVPRKDGKRCGELYRSILK